ncbi:MAG: methyl-accepting chemotaxis protein [Dehalococcoidia bacterium]
MKLTVARKLYGGFAIVIGLGACAGLFALVVLRSTTASVHTISSQNLSTEAATRDLQRDVLLMRAYSLQYPNTAATQRAEARERMAAQAALINKDLVTLKALDTTAPQRAFLEGADARLKAWYAARDTAIEADDRGDTMVSVGSAGYGDFEALLQGIEAFAQQTQVDATADNEAIDTSMLWNTVILVGLGAVMTLVGAAIAWWVARGITRNVVRMKVAAQGIAAGDLDQSIEVDSTDEIGDTASAFRDMLVYLGEMAQTAERIADGDLTVRITPKSDRDHLGVAFVRMVSMLDTAMSETRVAAQALAESKDQLALVAEEAARATQEVARASGQVAEGTSQQAQAVQDINRDVENLALALQQVTGGAAQQAIAIEETSAVSDRVAAAATQMAASAERAAEGARSTTATAQEGASRVSETIAGIDRIKRALDAASHEVGELGARSAEIGEIVGTIDDIAAQTNLLALNAAIEAARAGEQGRGFAVVADEVRRLAERVSSATKEIAGLIGGVQQGVAASVRAMDEGTEQMSTGTAAAADAGSALQRILDAVGNVSTQIEQIAAGAADLRTSGGEMAQRIVEIRTVAEENARAAREMSATADSVGDAVSGIAAVAEENSAAMEQVSASAEQMSAQVEEIAASTNELGTMADRLSEQIAHFRLDERDAGAPASLQEFRRAA